MITLPENANTQAGTGDGDDGDDTARIV